MALVKIVSRWGSDKVLFEHEVADTDSGLAMRHALEAAASAKANLGGAYRTAGGAPC